jgi:hypothetical protein
MTTAERAEALQQLYLRLDELTTADEVETYGDFLHHLADLIADLDQAE